MLKKTATKGDLSFTLGNPKRILYQPKIYKYSHTCITLRKTIVLMTNKKGILK